MIYGGTDFALTGPAQEELSCNPAMRGENVYMLNFWWVRLMRYSVHEFSLTLCYAHHYRGPTTRGTNAKMPRPW